MNPQYRYLKLGNREKTIGLIFGKLFHTTPLITSCLCQLYNTRFIKTFYINNAKKVFLSIPYELDEYIEKDQTMNELNERLENIISKNEEDKSSELEQLSAQYQEKGDKLDEQYKNLNLVNKELTKILKLNGYIEQDEELIFPCSSGIMIYESMYISHHCNEPYTCLSLNIQDNFDYDLIIDESLLREILSEILDVNKEILKFNISVDEKELLIYLQEYRSYYDLLSSCLENNIKTRYSFKIEDKKDDLEIIVCKDYMSL